MSNSEEKPSSRVKMPNAMLLAVVALVALIAMQDAWAQVGDRSGKEVVETLCSTCHGIGAEGAPRIGDAEAWTERASQGLTTLTQHAINGIRKCRHMVAIRVSPISKSSAQSLTSSISQVVLG